MSRSLPAFAVCAMLFWFSYGCGPGPEEGRQFSRQDLGAFAWQTATGFDPAYAALEPGQAIPGARWPGGFPIVQAKIFHDSAGVSIQQFTARTEFTLRDEDLAQPLALRLAVIGENWEIYLNGTLLRSEMHFAPQHDRIQEQRTLRGMILPLPERLLNAGPNALTFHLAGDRSPVDFVPNDKIGFYLRDGYYIDRLDRLNADFTEYLDLTFISVYVFFGLYHLILFIWRPKIRFNLQFGVFAVLVGIYLFLRTNRVFVLFDGLDTSILTRIEYSSLFLLIPAFLLFLHGYFESGHPLNWFNKVAIAFNSSLALASLFSPYPWLRTLLYVWQSSMAFQIVLVLAITGLFIFRRYPGALPMGIAILIGLITAVWDIVGTATLWYDLRLFQEGFFGFVIFLVVSIARRVARVETDLENLTDDLREMNTAFYRFVPTQILEELDRKSATDLEVGDNVMRLMSVLFSDIRSFTSLSEAMSPEDNFRFLNSYLKRMEPIIQEHEGYVDKFIGDAVMALFSDAAEKRSGRTAGSTSDRAVNAAIQMRQGVREYNVQRERQNYRSIDIGIGIHTGALILGTIGSSNRIDTTVIGNTVNVASRIESLTSYFRVGILISEIVYQDLSDAGKYRSREVGSIVVKGKTEPVVLYEFFDTDDEQTIDLKIRTGDILRRGIEFYRAADFAAAHREFRSALGIYNADRVARMYYKISKRLMGEPAPDQWKGVIEFFHK